MSGEDAMYEVEINLPNKPKGELLQIPGLGTFENGNTYIITKDEADSFRTYHTRQVPVVNEEDDTIVGSSVELGPTLLQASKNMYGISVATAEPGSKQKNVGKRVTTSSADTSEPNPGSALADAETPTDNQVSTDVQPEGGDK